MRAAKSCPNLGGQALWSFGSVAGAHSRHAARLNGALARSTVHSAKLRSALATAPGETTRDFAGATNAARRDHEVTPFPGHTSCLETVDHHRHPLLESCRLGSRGHIEE